VTILARLAVVVAVLAAGAAGLYLGGHPGDLPGAVRDVFVDDSTAVQATAADVIKDNYTRKVPDKQLEDGSIKGMVDSLHDRFSRYFTPRERTVFEQSIGGQFGGVGMTVIDHRRGLLVTGVYKGTPAAKAGIKPGQLITKVNGKPIAGEPSDLATARIKGKPGTLVALTIERRPGGARRTVRIKRARITIPVVEGRLRRVRGLELGSLALATFSSGAHGQLKSQLNRLLKKGAKGFVIDLRHNGGGLLDEAVLVSSLLVPQGVIVTTKGRKRAKRVLKATGGAIPRKPLVVLVDGGTASASEIVTAALKERLGAKVVGRRTFGKGVFGQEFRLPNDGALDLTLGNYYTPKGRNLGGKGIPPDVRALDNPRTNRDEGLDRALEVLASEVRRAPHR
jgi:carboxyl-terminal processing protease